MRSIALWGRESRRGEIRAEIHNPGFSLTARWQLPCLNDADPGECDFHGSCFRHLRCIGPPLGAEIIFRGKRAVVLWGEHPYQQAVVIKFPDQLTLQQWYTSRAYQNLIPIREKTGDVLLISYDA